jgi:uncharacterized protein YdeI (YjbR/CyaY-like superfamily)
MARRTELDRLKRVTVRSRAQWRQWLERNHEQDESIWLVTYKKACGKIYVAYDDVVEEALCFGWIDGLRRPFDEERTMLHVSPRRPKSAWSKPNKERVERLIANGLMMPPGLEKIERARRDGSWSYLDDADELVIPDELSAAFEARPGSREAFNGLGEGLRRRALHFLKDAKGAATRLKRVEQILAIAKQKGRPKAAPEDSNKPRSRSRSAD